MELIWLEHLDRQRVKNLQALWRAGELMQFAPLLLVRSCALHRTGADSIWQNPTLRMPCRRLTSLTNIKAN